MRFIRLSLIGLYLFLGLSLFFLSMSSARSADSISIVPAKFGYSLSSVGTCRDSGFNWTVPDVSRASCEGYLASILKCTITTANEGWNPCKSITNSTAGYWAPKKTYTCPPDNNPEHTIQVDSFGNPSSAGQYCKRPEPENPCTKLKGLNDSLQVTKYFVDKTGGSPACKDGCEMTRVAGNAWEYWTDENNVTWAVASYVYSGNECSDDYNYREVQSAETPSSSQSTVPSSAASSADPTAPSSAASSAEPTSPSSATSSAGGTGSNPSSGSGTGNDPSCYGTNQGDVCNGDSGSTGSGGGAGSGDGSGTPPASSATPASGGEGTFTAPNGSKDYLKDVFSSDAVKSVQAQRDATLTKINEKMAQIKALTNINSISVSGDISPDVKSVRGNDVDFSGKDIISKFSISWVFYFVTALLCMDIILNRRKK